MKRIQTACVIVFALTASAHAQVLLNAGDVYTCSFSSLREVGSAPCLYEPAGGFAFSLSPDSFDVSRDVLFVEMFENGTNEPPLETFVAEFYNDGTALRSAWTDFQGTVRFTMLSGSATLESITFFRTTPTVADMCERYELTVVPARGAALVEQLAPCVGPRSGGKWKNHGAYVSAVAGAVRKLLTDGDISKQEAKDILRAAARSNCGKK